jgi:hypothetical protein
MDVLLLLVLILFNGVFAMSEIAIVSSRRARLMQLAETGRKGAERALALAAEPTRFLSSVQVGTTAIGILSGAIGEAVLAGRVRAGLERVPLLAPYAEVCNLRRLEHHGRIRVDPAGVVAPSKILETFRRRERRIAPRVPEASQRIDVELAEQMESLVSAERQECPFDQFASLANRCGGQVARSRIGEVLLDGFLDRWNVNLGCANLS